MDLIIGAIYKPFTCVNGEEIPRGMKLVSADLGEDKFILKSIDAFFTAEVNRDTFEYYFRPMEKINL